MKFRNRLTRQFEQVDRGVSPVIGVILMVAITVILAATIGTFVLDLGGSVQQQAPQASLTVQDHSNDWQSGTTSEAFEIDHEGGDDLSLGDIKIQVRNNSDNQLMMEWDDGGFDTNDALYLNGNGPGPTGIVSTGDRLMIEDTTSPNTLSDDTKYKIVVIDKETGNSIVESTVTLR